jgi:hypothetical protein
LGTKKVWVSRSKEFLYNEANPIQNRCTETTNPFSKQFDYNLMNQSSQDKTTNDVAEEHNCEKPACLLIEPVSLKRGITSSNWVNHVY